jgi:hypothetical protein
MNPAFPISTLSLRENHTPAALARQVQIGIAILGSETAEMGPKNLPQGFARSILVQGVIRSKAGARSDGLREECPMKLRIRGNSIRLRLGQSEVAQLVKDGRVHASIQFSAIPKSQLSYTLVTSPTEEDISAQLVDSEIKVTVPEGLARGWANSEQVGLKNVQQIDGKASLWILIEKDFQSLEPRPDDDQSDNFKNPFEGKKHCSHP